MDFQTNIKLDDANDILLVSYNDSIKNNIKNILSKTDSKRPFREHLHINYDEIYQVGINDITMNIIQSNISEILKQNETRIQLTSVETIYYKTQKTLVITIKYFIIIQQQNDVTAISVTF